MVSARDGRVITFYSYKGGTGRSMALAHAAWITARRGYRVLAIDWDLEAPGLHRYFAPFLEDKSASSKDGLIDFLLNYCDAASMPPPDSIDGRGLSWLDEYAELWRYAQRVELPGVTGRGCLDFVSAGRQDDMYGMRVGLFDWNHFYSELGGGAFLNRMRNACISSEVGPEDCGQRTNADTESFAQSRYDFVFIDSRTGLSDTSGICTVQLPDTLVCLFTYNVQSIEGASRVLRSARTARKKMAEAAASAARTPGSSPIGAVRVIPVPSRAELGDTVRLSRMREFALPHFAEFLASACESSLDPLQSLIDVELPYIYTLSYNEVLSLLDEAADPKSYLGIMHRLTTRICPDRGDDSLLSIDRSLANSMWEQYQDVLTGPEHTGKRDAPATEEKTDPLRIDSALRAMLASETDAGRVSVRRVLVSLASSGAEQGLSSSDGFAPYEMFQLRQPERDAAERLVRAGILCARFDPSVEGRVIAPVNDDLFRQSAAVNEWLVEYDKVIQWKREIGLSYARATNGLDDEASLSDAAYEARADLERRFWDELTPREQRIWRVVKERKRAELQRAEDARLMQARLSETRLVNDARLEEAKNELAGLRTDARAKSRRVGIIAASSLLLFALASGWSIYTQRTLQERLERSAASTKAWEAARYGYFMQAKEAFTKLIEKYPDDAGYRMGRAYAESRRLSGAGSGQDDKRANWKAAAQDMEYGITLQEKNREVVDPSTFYQVATWYDRAGDAEMAIRAARRFISVARESDNAANFQNDIANAQTLIKKYDSTGAAWTQGASK